MLTRILAACLLLISTLATATAQLSYDPHKNYVIAENGLRVRDAPGDYGRPLTSVPYGTRVEIILDEVFLLDTLTGGDRPIVEYWVPIRQGKRTGWVFGSYLAYNQPPALPEAGLNEDVVLLLPHETCAENLYDPTAYRWTGVYRYQNRSWRKPVSVSYRYTRYGNAASALLTDVSEEKYLQFVVGTKKSIPAGRLDVLLREPFTVDPSVALSSRDTQLLARLQLVPGELPDGRRGLYYAGGHPELQVLSTQPYYRIEWVGDLNADGTPDYLLEIGEGGMVRELVLSQPDGTLRRVAIWEDGYCC